MTPRETALALSDEASDETPDSSRTDAPNGSAMATVTPGPGHEDYETIRQAVMETARGRWFLDEFARANRNADTKTVLAAVARLEQALIDKQALKPPAEPAAVQTPYIDLESLRNGLAAIEAMIAAREDSAKPVLRNATKLQDMIWTMREGGTDLRLCHLLGTQTDAVIAGHTALLAADSEIAEAVADLASELAGVTPGSVEATDDREEPAQSVSADVSPPVTESIATQPALTTTAFVEPSPAAEADDVAEANSAAETIETIETIEKPVVTNPSRSLGDAVLTGGLVSRPPPKHDLLAPLRRMSQAEKVAFFT